jgi:hypothetical protein
MIETITESNRIFPLDARPGSLYPSVRVFTDEEYADAKAYEEKKWRQSRANGLQNDLKEGSGLSAKEANRVGMHGEWAAPLILGLDPHEVLYAEEIHPDFDFIWYEKRIDVKTTRHKEGKLIINEREIEKKWDVALLCVGSERKYRLVGYITKRMALVKGNATKKNQWTNRAGGCTFEQSEVYPWEWLECHCKYGASWLEWWKRECNYNAIL